MYILLLGAPGVRKSTAIRYGKGLLKRSGFKRFAPDRMSRQAFINELHAINQPEALGLDLAAQLDMTTDYPHEMAVWAPEFVDFIGQHDKDYLMLLTGLWDNEEEYTNPKISKTSIKVVKPTINLISAATPENVQLAFPAGSMDTGTLSRFLFVHGEPTGKKILFPSLPNPAMEKALVLHLEAVSKLEGPLKMTPAAVEALKWIYENTQPLTDPRFKYYNGRRFTHLLKLLIVVVASDLRLEATEQDVLQANTILGMTEYNMPQALGHYGRSRQSTIMHSILDWIKEQAKPVTVGQIFEQFSPDFNSEREFQGCLEDLQHSKKLIPLKKEGNFIGFIVREAEFPQWLKPLMLTELLTQQERVSIGL